MSSYVHRMLICIFRRDRPSDPVIVSLAASGHLSPRPRPHHPLHRRHLLLPHPSRRTDPSRSPRSSPVSSHPLFLPPNRNLNRNPTSRSITLPPTRPPHPPHLAVPNSSTYCFPRWARSRPPPPMSPPRASPPHCSSPPPTTPQRTTRQQASDLPSQLRPHPPVAVVGMGGAAVASRAPRHRAPPLSTTHPRAAPKQLLVGRPGAVIELLVEQEQGRVDREEASSSRSSRRVHQGRGRYGERTSKRRSSGGWRSSVRRRGRRWWIGMSLSDRSWGCSGYVQLLSIRLPSHRISGGRDRTGQDRGVGSSKEMGS